MIKKRNKYGNKKIEFEGIKFDSKAEMNRYFDLLWLEKAKLITNLRLKPVYKIVVNGQKIGNFTPDFDYLEKNKLIVEDVKSIITAKETYYRFKIKVFQALYSELTFREIIY